MTNTSTIVVIAHTTQNQPSWPPQPSSTDPPSTLNMPVGSSSDTTSNGHTHPSQRTNSLRCRRGRPGWVRYQWPSSIASVTAPRNIAPANVRSRDTSTLPPASIAAATRPTDATAGATRSSTGGNSRPPSFTTVSRSMPVIAATRAERRYCSSVCPATPALRRTMLTTSTPNATPAVASAAPSRTGTTPKRNPASAAPTANSR